MIRHVLDKFLLIFEEQAHASSEDAVAEYIKAGQQISFTDFFARQCWNKGPSRVSSCTFAQLSCLLFPQLCFTQLGNAGFEVFN